MPYEFDWQVRVADSDFSGLVYTPAVLDYSIRAINELMSTFDFAAYQQGEAADVIYPTKHAEVEFVEPIGVGDEIVIAVTPELGETSVTFVAEGWHGDERAFEATVVMVFVDADTLEPVSIPGGVRTGLEPYTAR